MRVPSIRDPQSIWDIFAVGIAYVMVEYIVLQVTGSYIVQQEMVVFAILVFSWMMWAVLNILK